MSKIDHNKRKHLLNRGLMWGRLLAFLEMGAQGTRAAHGFRFLLSPADQELLDKVDDMMVGLNQRAWEAQVAEVAQADGKPARKSKRTRSR